MLVLSLFVRPRLKYVAHIYCVLVFGCGKTSVLCSTLTKENKHTLIQLNEQNIHLLSRDFTWWK